MGRSRKRFNEKARQSGNTEVYRDVKEQVEVDINIQEDKYDSNNPLVICGKKKRKVIKSQNEVSVPKPLSRKQKKRLEKILINKKKKINREEVLKNLKKFQLTSQESDLFQSTASLQTLGRRKLLLENAEGSKCSKIRTIKDSNKKKNIPSAKKIKLDPNVVEFEISSSESDGESEDESKNVDNIHSTKNDIDSAVSVDNSSPVDNDKGSSDVAITVLNEDSKGKDPLQNTLQRKDSLQNTSQRKDPLQNTSQRKDPLQKTLQEKDDNTKDKDKQLPVDTTQQVPTMFVSLNRLPEIQAAREALPIFCEEQSIMEAIREHSVVVIHGVTGSGKTTQIPQFLYEGGYTQNKMIGITEPRRIAAMTMSTRVGKEMNLPNVVSYHVRYENNITEKTRIKFMTDGVLLKEMRRDFFLTRYSAIIIDEAHERSVFSDVLIGLLSRVVTHRAKKGCPLKLIIMSATIRVDDFLENPRLFKEPPFLITLESRHYNVQVHFNLQTPSDYLEAAYHKVCQIHSQLPSGTILVFLTGEKEVKALCKKLQEAFPLKDNQDYKSENLSYKNTYYKENFKKKNKIEESNDTSFASLPLKIDLDNYSVEPLDTENLQHELSDDEEATVTQSYPFEKYVSTQPLYTLPLYSILPFQEQEKVFQPPPAGTRLCVVSTNVAETSITIPGLKYVVDSGKVKTKVFDDAGGISKFCITWTSKASANQRAGRAGRTEGGHCYRLYSSAVFNNEFEDFPCPEIQRTPVDDVLLQMKAMGIDRVVNFPFPSPPDNEALKAAERRLVTLGALQDLNKGERYKDIEKWEYSAKVTPFGEVMARFPLSPRYAKMLILSYKHSCVPYMIAIVSAMTVHEVFHSTSDADGNNNSQERSIWNGIKTVGSRKSLELGDAMVLLKAVGLFEESKKKVRCCINNGIRHKAMVEIHKMCLQLRREMNQAFQDLSLPLELNIPPPNEEQLTKIRKIITTGFLDHVARLLPQEETKSNKELKNAYKCLDVESPVFIHPSSILFSELPRYIVYQEIIHTSKYYMKGIIEIEPEWLVLYAPTLCQYSSPLEEPTPAYDHVNDKISCAMNVTFGPYQWELPPVIDEMPKCIRKYYWFAFFLVDGQIHDFFKRYKAHLITCPHMILKEWARIIPRVRNLLNALIGKEVDSRKSLIKMWETEPKYLLTSCLEWISPAKHMEILSNWPPQE